MLERRSSRSCWFALLALVLVGGVVGCAQDVGDIDRTQPDKVQKSIFKDDDEWYFQQTVIDTTVEGQSGIDTFPWPTRSQGTLFTAQVSRQLKRIQWEIHEEVLYARSTVEPAEGITEQVDGEENHELGIVAAFPIKSHFDIQRKYNTSTGEPSNVIVENKSDRPWYEREYMRVDWSKNMVTSTSSVFSGLGLMSPKARAKTQRATPQSEDRTDPQRTRISEDVVDTTSQYVFNPDLFACVRNFGSDSLWRCEGGTATVRNFFWRVEARKEKRYGDADKHYKPMQYRDDKQITKEGSNEPIMAGTSYAGGSRVEAQCNEQVNQQNEELFATTKDEWCSEASFGLFSRFGYFRTSRTTWNPDRETYDGGRQQYANRWNIWETMYDDDGEMVPLEEREPEPIVFHLNAGYPKHMMKPAEAVEAKWDQTFKKAVAVAKGTTVSEVESMLGQAKGHPEKQMFVIRKNSCHPSQIAEWREIQGGTKDADRRDISGIFDEYTEGFDGSTMEKVLWNMPIKRRKRLCTELEWATAERQSPGARFTWERLGDLRYSFFSWIRDYNIGWLGYGPSSADPKTGEIISAAANFAGRLLEPYANHSADIVKYLNGEYSRSTIEDGDHVRRQLNRQQAEGGDGEQKQALYEKSPDRVPRDDDAPIGRGRRLSLDAYRAEGEVDRSRERTGEDPAREIGRSIDYLEEAAYRSIDASISADAGNDSRMLEWLEEPGMKEQLMSNPMRRKAVEALARERGVRSGEGSGEGAKEDRLHQAYLGLHAPLLFEVRRDRRQRLLRKNNIYSAEAAEKLAEGLAMYSGAVERFKGKSHDEIAEYFRKKIFYGTQLHEIGHTVGLRHNFSASLDALNYHDPFWKIEKLKQVGCKGVPNTGICSDGKVTDEEARRGGPQLADAILETSSGEKDSTPYEDVYDNPGYISQAEYRLSSVMDYTAAAPGRFAGLGKYDQAAINFAYARHVQMFNDKVNIREGLDFDLREADYEKTPAVYHDTGYQNPRAACETNGEPDPGCLEAGINEITEQRTWVPIEDAVEHRRDILVANGNAVKKFETGEASYNKVKEQVKYNHIVPYNFCTDDREGRSLGCQAFDWGSNQFEVLGYAVEEFKALQPFNRYRGAEINARGFISQFMGLQNNYIGEVLDTLSLVDTPFRYFSFYQKLGYDVGAYTEDLAQASRLGLNFYGELLTTPKPSRYCYYRPQKVGEEQILPKFNMNEKAIQPEGAFVPDDLFYRSNALSECRAEIVRIHQVVPQKHTVEATVDGTTVRASYTPRPSDTPTAVATALKSALEAELPEQSLKLEVYDADLVATPLTGVEEYSLDRADEGNEASREAWTRMSSPHSVEKRGCNVESAPKCTSDSECSGSKVCNANRCIPESCTCSGPGGCSYGVGEYFSYDYTPEYNYRVDRVGTFIDKVLAASRLFQIDANITFAEFSTDLRATNITYWTEFPDALYNMLHGMFLGDFRGFGGGYSPTSGRYERWNLLQVDQKSQSLAPNRRGMSGQVWPFISPSSFNIRLQLLANALAEFSTYEDKVTDFDEFLVVAATEQERQNLPDELKIDGGPEDKDALPNGPNGNQMDRRVDFIHPITSRRYVAIRAEDGRSITFDLLRWAREVKEQYENASNSKPDDWPGIRENAPTYKEMYREDLENIVAKINLIRDLRQIYGPDDP